MRGEDSEIDRADQAFAGKFCRAETKIITAQDVIGDVKHQKKSRDRGSGHHAKAVPDDLPTHYEIKAGQQKNAAESVEAGIQMRKYL